MSYGEDILERYLVLLVPDRFVRNFRPDWLFGLELDFFFPNLKVAFEFQGDHHYVDTDYCLSSDPVKRRDRCKRRICREKGIALIKVDAVDLEYTRLRSLMKYTRRWGPKDWLWENDDKLRVLNKEATAYRKILKKNFKSVTVMRRWNPHRKAMLNPSMNPQ